MLCISSFLSLYLFSFLNSLARDCKARLCLQIVSLSANCAEIANGCLLQSLSFDSHTIFRNAIGIEQVAM
ncbi:hypothetical protein RB195_022933 [Necator americanus]|uniref:Secreted protein n=1 Tax=Necator americanus TaxID=51031 RepID=A0ABR1EH73_NECAM